jgi:hypothetical protein
VIAKCSSWNGGVATKCEAQSEVKTAADLHRHRHVASALILLSHEPLHEDSLSISYRTFRTLTVKTLDEPRNNLGSEQQPERCDQAAAIYNLSILIVFVKSS